MLRSTRVTTLAVLSLVTIMLTVVGAGSSLAKKGDVPEFRKAVASTAGGDDLMYVGRLDGNPWKDLMYGAFRNKMSLSTSMGRANARFGDPTYYQSGPYGGLRGAAGDITGDGVIDSVFGGDKTLSANVGLGNGVFGGITESQYGDFDNPDQDQVLADMNGDGLADYVGINRGNSGANPLPPFIGVAMSKGDGTFRSPVLTTLPTGNPAVVAAADLDGDGKRDVVVGNVQRTTVYWGNGSGGFAGSTNLGQRSRSIVLANVDQQNGKDVIVSYNDGNVVGVILNRGSRSFAPSVRYSAHWPGQVAVADMNEDGWKDIGVTDYWNKRVVLLLNGRDGTFDTSVKVRTPAGPGNLALSDVTKDDRPDILAQSAESGDDRMFVLVNKG